MSPPHFQHLGFVNDKKSLMQTKQILFTKIESQGVIWCSLEIKVLIYM